MQSMEKSEFKPSQKLGKKLKILDKEIIILAEILESKSFSNFLLEEEDIKDKNIEYLLTLPKRYEIIYLSCYLIASLSKGYIKDTRPSNYNSMENKHYCPNCKANIKANLIYLFSDGMVLNKAYSRCITCNQIIESNNVNIPFNFNASVFSLIDQELNIEDTSPEKIEDFILKNLNFIFLFLDKIIFFKIIVSYIDM